jgi:uncharacterized protein
MKSNVVTWFEIYTEDLNRAKKFYQDVFLYEMIDAEMPEGMDVKMCFFPYVENAPNSNGSLVYAESMKPGVGGTVVYFASQDCAIEEARVVASGGKVIQSKFPIGQHGYICLIMDSEGNMIGIHSVN